MDAAPSAIAAHRARLGEHIRGIASRFAGPKKSRGCGAASSGASLEMAACTHGTTLRDLDFSDTYRRRSAGHPSAMIGALLATAEATDCAGAALTAALVLACKLHWGLCDAVALREHGVDQAICAVVGAAAGEANSLALAPNAHVFNVRKGTLSEWKGCAGPDGVVAVALIDGRLSGGTYEAVRLANPARSPPRARCASHTRRNSRRGFPASWQSAAPCARVPKAPSTMRSAGLRATR